MSHLPGKFVWFECVTHDLPRAQRFYGEVLGWKVEAFPMGSTTYPLIKAGDTAVGGYVPLSDTRTAPHWISSLSVDDVDATARAVTAAGGTVLEPPADLPPVGRSAKIADPFGTQLYLFRAAGADAADGPPTSGRFYWNELWTRDAGVALAFYETVIGYTHSDMDLGPQGTYRVLEKGGVPRGGIMTSPRSDAPPMWLPYVAVGDCDATVTRAGKLGGAVVAAPDDLPGVGRFAILADPAGATFAVIKPAPR